jgi:hypothetical protein
MKKTEVFRDELTAMAKAALDANEEAAAKADRELEDTPLPDLGEDGEPSGEIIPEPAKKPEPIITVPVAADTVSKADYEKLEQKIKVLEGIAKKDAKLEKINELTELIKTLQAENASLKDKTPPAKAAEADKEKLQSLATSFGVGDEDITSLKELMQAVASKAADEAVSGLKDEVGAVTSHIAKTAGQTYRDKLVSRMPDAYEVGESVEFSNWLKENDWLESFVTAHQSQNAEKVLDKLTKYKAATAPKPDLEAEAEEAERQRLIAEQAAGPGKGNGPKPPVTEDKILTGLEATRFKSAYIDRDKKYWPDGPGGKPSPKAKAMFERLTGQV